ncbi:CLIP4 protein, partial [Polyodon spathula]|nr:CLIP4 protein [Polyodon spathula]
SEILKCGCNFNDRDGLTDMSLIHYTCKAGAQGIDENRLQCSGLGGKTQNKGLLSGEWCIVLHLKIKCMEEPCVMYSLLFGFFDVTDADGPCSDFDFGTVMHIAASNLCVPAVKCLLEHGAKSACRVNISVVTAVPSQ